MFVVSRGSTYLSPVHAYFYGIANGIVTALPHRVYALPTNTSECVVATLVLTFPTAGTTYHTEEQKKAHPERIEPTIFRRESNQHCVGENRTDAFRRELDRCFSERIRPTFIRRSGFSCVNSPGDRARTFKVWWRSPPRSVLTRNGLSKVQISPCETRLLSFPKRTDLSFLIELPCFGDVARDRGMYRDQMPSTECCADVGMVFFMRSQQQQQEQQHDNRESLGKRVFRPQSQDGRNLK